MSLRNRVALVTGGSRGIGRGVATRLAKDGARVAIAYRSNKAAAQQTLRTLQSAALVIGTAGAQPELTGVDAAGLALRRRRGTSH